MQLLVLVALIFGAAVQVGCGPEVIPVVQQPQAVLRLTAETQTAAVGEEVLIESTVTGGAWDVPINGNPVLDRASAGEAVLVDGVWYMPVGGQYVTYPVVGVPYVAPTTLVHPSPYVYWDGTRYVIVGSGMCYPVSYETVPQTRAYVSPVGPAASASSAKFSATAPDVYIVRCRTSDGQVAHITINVNGNATPVGGRVTINITGPLGSGPYTINLGDLTIDITAIPSEGIAVYCNEYPGTIIGRVVVDGNQLVFQLNADGLAWLRRQIAVNVTQQVTLQFNIGGDSYTFVVNVVGTQVVPAGGVVNIVIPGGGSVVIGQPYTITVNLPTVVDWGLVTGEIPVYYGTGTTKIQVGVVTVVGGTPTIKFTAGLLHVTDTIPTGTVVTIEVYFDLGGQHYTTTVTIAGTACECDGSDVSVVIEQGGN